MLALRSAMVAVTVTFPLATGVSTEPLTKAMSSIDRVYTVLLWSDISTTSPLVKTAVNFNFDC